MCAKSGIVSVFNMLQPSRLPIYVLEIVVTCSKNYLRQNTDSHVQE